MIADKGRDEEIGMVVAVMEPQIKVLARRVAGAQKSLGLQLVFQKIIACALIDQNGAVPFGPGN